MANKTESYKFLASLLNKWNYDLACEEYDGKFYVWSTKEALVEIRQMLFMYGSRQAHKIRFKQIWLIHGLGKGKTEELAWKHACDFLKRFNVEGIG